MNATDADVAVVGLGPVGALAALLLAESGLRVVVLERSREPMDEPRAVGIDGESLRAFQRIGLGDAVSAVLQPPREREEVCFADSRRRRLLGLEIPDSGPNGWRDLSFFDQPELEALLRRELGRRDAIEVRLGREVIGIAPSDDAVELRTADAAGGASGSVRASFAIGCDGASSTVRRALDIDWQSLGYDQEWLVVDVLQSPGADLPLTTMQVCDPERLVTYVCAKDPNRRWEFQLRPDETPERMLRPERIEALLRPWLPPEHYRIRRAAVYQFHAATAARWRHGRVFLAGDAAHQMPPFLGQGLNTGFRDAVNLGWKLPLVHAGLCEERLLDSYAAERDAHARGIVDQAVAVGRLMETLAAREAGVPDPHAVDPNAGPGQGRPLRGGVLVGEQAGGGEPAGRLLHQPSVRCEDGAECRLDALLGRGFAIVGRKASDLRLGPQARAVAERLDAAVVSLEGLEATHGAFDPLFDRHPAALVRPDRYVFGVVDEDWDLDGLLPELGRALALRGAGQ